MKKVYFLQTCDTCRRILKEVNIEGFERQEIKANPVTVSQLEEMYSFSNSYEALFNKRAKKYKAMDLERPSDAAPGLKAGECWFFFLVLLFVLFLHCF